jgi:HlyD family secretion protein
MSLHPANPTSPETLPSPPTANGPSASSSLATNPFSPPVSPHRRRRRAPLAIRATIWSVLGLIAVYGLGFAIAGFSSGKARFSWWQGERQPFDGPLWTVKKEKLQLAIVELGTLESAENRDIVCHVKAGQRGNVATSIKWVIDDGSEVRRGQRVIELDDSAMQQERKDQEIKLDQAKAAAVKSEEELNITKDQNAKEIETAKAQVVLADLALRRYLGGAKDGKEGEYQQKRNEFLGQLEMAKSDLEMWQDKAAWSQRMLKRGLLSSNQVEGDQARLRSAFIAVDRITGQLAILQDYEKKWTETDLLTKHEEAKRQLILVQAQARSKENTATADRDSKRNILKLEESRLAEILGEIEKCYIDAPHDGLVVYFMPEERRFGGGSSSAMVAQGEPVKEGQKMMRIPNLHKMQVSARVHEAMVSKLKTESVKNELKVLKLSLMSSVSPWDQLANAVVYPELREDLREKAYDRYFDGHPAYVRVHAHAAHRLKGRVKTVANVSSQAEYFSSDVKVYTTIVSIDKESMDWLESIDVALKPGMSAEVTILADDSPQEVLTIPIQSVVGAVGMAGKRKVFVVGADGDPEERDIEVGRSNESMVEVLKGLQEGEKVVMNPQPLLVGERAKLKQAPMSTKRGRGELGGGFGGEKKKGKGFGGPGGPAGANGAFPAADGRPGTQTPREGSERPAFSGKKKKE